MIQADERSLSRSKLIVALWLLGIVAILGFTFVSMGGTGDAADVEPAKNSTEEADTGVPPGEVAPPATFETIDGPSRNLSEFRGEQLVVWFPALGCSTCQQQASTLAANRSQIQNLTLVVVPLQSSPEEASRFAREFAPETLNESNWVWGKPSDSMVETYNPQGVHGYMYLVNTSGVVVETGSRPATNLRYLQGFSKHPSYFSR